jgi:uncharacterized protein YkwD
MTGQNLPPRRPVEQLVHAHVNQVRERHGVSELSFDEELRGIARSHSEDMAEREYFSHTSPEGASFADRYREHGYDCRVPVGPRRHANGAENIAMRAFSTRRWRRPARRTQTPPEISRGTVEGWLDSRGHRENMLDSNWRRQGIGVAAVERGRRIHVYVTQNFC